MDSRKSSSKENRNTVRKSFLRNPEVPLNNDQTNNKNKRVTIYGPECSKKSENKEQQTSRKSLHEPTINKLAEWRKVLEEVKQYTIQDSIKQSDIGQDAQKLINHAVSHANINFKDQTFRIKRIFVSGHIEAEFSSKRNSFQELTKDW
jgi:hypothetical protein